MKKFIKGFIVLTVVLILSFFIGMTIGEQVISVDKTILAGYKYDTTLKCYKNSTTGIWYTTTVDGKIIPSLEYVSPKYKDQLEGLVVEDRPSECWELVAIIEIDVSEKDTFYSLVDKYYEEYFRMDYDWYVAKVKEVNGIEDVNIIRNDVKFKIPVYEDSEN